MSKEFEVLNTEYVATSLDQTEKLAEIEERMRANLMERNDNKDTFGSLSILKASHDELVEINNMMEEQCCDPMENMSKEIRETQTARNFYTSKNPYPGGCK